MNLESLVLELYADTSRLDREVKSAVDRAASQIKKLERGSLGINVNEKSLHNLNKLLDVKQKHIKQTAAVFKNNPINVSVRSKDVATALKEVERLKKKIGHNSIGLKVTHEYKSKTPEKEGSQSALINEVKKGNSQSKRVEDAIFKTGKDMAGAVLKGNLMASATQGLFGGVGKGIKSIADNAIADRFGSSELLGRKISEALIKGISSEIGLMGEELGLVADRMGLTPLVKKIKDGFGDIGESLSESIDELLGEERILERGKRAKEKAKEKNVLTGEGREGSLVFAREKYNQKQTAEDNYRSLQKQKEALEKRANIATTFLENVDYSLVSDEDMPQYQSDIAIAEKTLESFSAEMEELESNIKIAESVLRQKNKEFNRAFSDLKRVTPKGVNPVYLEAASAIFGKFDEGELPKVVKGENMGSALGNYSYFSNEIELNDDFFEQFQTGEYSDQLMHVLLHELRHAKQAGMGKFEGFRQALNSQGQIIPELATPNTIEEAQGIAQFLKSYEAKGKNQYVLDNEADAELTARRELEGIKLSRNKKQNKVNAVKHFGMDGGRISEKLGQDLIQGKIAKIEAMQSIMESLDMDSSLLYQSLLQYKKLFTSYSTDIDRLKETATEIAIGKSDIDATVLAELIASKVDKFGDGLAAFNLVEDELIKGIKKQKVRKSAIEAYESGISNLTKKLDEAFGVEDSKSMRLIRRQAKAGLKALQKDQSIDIEDRSILAEQYKAIAKQAKIDGSLVAKTTEITAGSVLANPIESLQLTIDKSAGEVVEIFTQLGNAMSGAGERIKDAIEYVQEHPLESLQIAGEGALAIGGGIVGSANKGARAIAPAISTAYGMAQGAENVALDLLPYGRLAKKGLQAAAVVGGLPLAAATVPALAPVGGLLTGAGHLGGALAGGAAASQLGSIASIPIIGGQVAGLLTTAATGLGTIIGELGAAGIAINVVGQAAKSLIQPETKQTFAALEPSREQYELAAQESIANQITDFGEKYREAQKIIGTGAGYNRRLGENIGQVVHLLPEAQKEPALKYAPVLAMAEQVYAGDMDYQQKYGIPGLKGLSEKQFAKLPEFVQKTIKDEIITIFKRVEQAKAEIDAQLSGLMGDNKKGILQDIQTGLGSKLSALREKGIKFGVDSEKLKIDKLGDRVESIDVSSVAIPDISKIKRDADVSMESIGRAQAEGIESAFTSKMPEVVEAQVAEVAKARQLIKDNEGIASPSKVWADKIGKPLGQGVEVGAVEALQKAGFSISSEIDKLKATIAKDLEYFRAVATGDTTKAQQMVENAAKGAGYNVGPVYHGTKADFTEFDPNMAGRNMANNQFGPSGFWFTQQKEYASRWAKKGKVLSTYINPGNILEDPNALLTGKEQFAKPDYDSIITDKVVLAKRPNQIKSADPITKTDTGSVVPLSARFDESVADIRGNVNDIFAGLKSVAGEGLAPLVAEIEDKFSAIGDNSVESLMSALEGALGQLQTTGKLIGESLAEGTKESLEMSSPSKVFIRIGKDAILGFELGIDGAIENIRKLEIPVPELENQGYIDLEGFAKSIDKLEDYAEIIQNIKSATSIGMNETGVESNKLARLAVFESRKKAQSKVLPIPPIYPTIPDPWNIPSAITLPTLPPLFNPQWEQTQLIGGYPNTQIGNATSIAMPPLPDFMQNERIEHFLGVLQRDVDSSFDNIELQGIDDNIRDIIESINKNLANANQSLSELGYNQIQELTANHQKAINAIIEAQNAILGDTSLTNEDRINEFERLQSEVASMQSRVDSQIESILTPSNGGGTNRGIFSGLRQQFPIIDQAIAKVEDLRNSIANFGMGALKLIGLAILTKSLVDLGVEAVNVYRRFEGIFIASRMVGNGAQYLEKVREQTKALGGDLESTMRSAIQFSTALTGTNLESTGQQLFLDSDKALKSLGLQTQEYDNAMRAIIQISSKGKVSMEEISGQLGEQVPGALQIAADAMQTNVKGLIQMVSSGNLLSEDFIPKFVQQLKNRTAFLAPAVEQSLNASIGRLGAQKEDLLVNIGAEISPAIIPIVNTLSGALKLLTDNFEAVVFGAKTLALYLASPALIAGLKAIPAVAMSSFTTLKGIMTGVTISAKTMWTAVLGPIKMVAFVAATAGLESLFYVMSGGSADIRNTNKELETFAKTLENVKVIGDQLSWFDQVKNFTWTLVIKPFELPNKESEMDSFINQMDATIQSTTSNLDDTGISNYIDQAQFLQTTIEQLKAEKDTLMFTDPVKNKNAIKEIESQLYGDDGLITKVQKDMELAFVPGGRAGIEEQMRLIKTTMDYLKQDTSLNELDKNLPVLESQYKSLEKSLVKFDLVQERIGNGLNRQRLAWITLTSAIAGYEDKLSTAITEAEISLYKFFNQQNIGTETQSLLVAQFDLKRQEAEAEKLTDYIASRQSYLQNELTQNSISLVEEISGKSLLDIDAEGISKIEQMIANEQDNVKAVITDQVLGELKQIVENKQALLQARLEIEKSKNAVRQAKIAEEDYVITTSRSIFDFNKDVGVQLLNIQNQFRDYNRQLEDASINSAKMVRGLVESYNDLNWELENNILTVQNELADAQDRLELTNLKIQQEQFDPGQDTIGKRAGSIILKLFESINSGESEKRRRLQEANQAQKEYTDTLRRVRDFEEQVLQERINQRRQLEDLTTGFQNLNQAVKDLVLQLNQSREDLIRNTKNQSGRDISGSLIGVPSVGEMGGINQPQAYNATPIYTNTPTYHQPNHIRYGQSVDPQIRSNSPQDLYDLTNKYGGNYQDFVPQSVKNYRTKDPSLAPVTEWQYDNEPANNIQSSNFTRPSYTQSPIARTTPPTNNSKDLLLAKLIIAEAKNQGLIGQALVARSVENRQRVGNPRAYLAQSNELEDIIYAKGQYEPVRSKSNNINTPRSESQLNLAYQAIELARDVNRLKSELAKQGLNPTQIKQLVNATGFRAPYAKPDASQQYNQVRYKGHIFNSDKNARNRLKASLHFGIPESVEVGRVAGDVSTAEEYVKKHTETRPPFVPPAISNPNSPEFKNRVNNNGQPVINNGVPKLESDMTQWAKPVAIPTPSATPTPLSEPPLPSPKFNYTPTTPLPLPVIKDVPDITSPNLNNILTNIPNFDTDKSKGLNSQLLQLKNQWNKVELANIKANQKLNELTAISEMIGLVQQVDDNIRQMNFSLIGSADTVNRMAQEAKGYLTISEEIQNVGLDTARNIENEINSREESARGLRREVGDSLRQLDIQKEQLKTQDGISQETKDILINSIATLENLIQQKTTQANILEGEANRLAQTKNIAVANKVNLETMQRTLEVSKQMSNVKSELADARYSMGGSLFNTGAIQKAKDEYKFTLQEMELEAQKMEGIKTFKEIEQYKKDTKELAEINIAKSYLDAIPVLRDFSSGLKDIILMTSSWQEVAKKLLDTLAGLVLDQLVILPMQNWLAQSAGGLLSWLGVAGFAKGTDNVKIPNYAGGLESAFNKEKLQSGKRPYLAVLHQGEAVLSTLNGDAQLLRQLKATGQWEHLKSSPQLDTFATGTEWHGNKNNQSFDNKNQTTIYKPEYKIYAQDANSFRKSQAQIEQESLSRLRRARR